MGNRQNLHNLLVSILGSANVYFQPPPTVTMKYPCIVYEWSSNATKFADDNPYSHTRKYTVTAIDTNPDSAIPDKLSALPMSSFDRPFTTNNLRHYVFTIYY